MLLNFLITLLLVLLNGFFVAAEFAIVKVRASQLEMKAQAGNAAARLSTRILGNLDGYLAATQLGITLASLGLGWIGEPVVSKILIAGMHAVGLELDEKLAHQIALPVAFVVITILHIVFGELAPKSLAIQQAEKTTLAVSYPLQFFFLIFRPVIWLLNGIAAVVLRLFGITVSHSTEVHSADELKYLVHQSQQDYQAKEDHTEGSDLTLVEKAFQFSERSVRQIMTPRTQIFGIDVLEFNQAILDEIIAENYSRIPCYEENLDHVLGVVYLKEILLKLQEGPGIDIRSLIKPTFFVPSTKRIRPLLREFQQSRQQMAIVINEYGGTEGLITMEDILEELVGEIQDESDEERPIVEQVDEHRYRLRATSSLLDLNALLPRPIQKRAGYETLAGILVERFGRLPAVGQMATVDRYEIKIESIENNAIGLVLLKDLGEEPLTSEE
ncbi:hemolysin [Siphonobacter sp. BAB-5385]|uniref:hemolysin family protein n=1 Tax=Siphonobacter sp. BAB-5385 TaxID=1864822 RepID=UPI000B9E1D30|nr:hemolysin family protein [Siphonobacter sp. BAB-5385]OZI09674.1 hemolysin [Siphonobacter sp. BAB-5385]